MSNGDDKNAFNERLIDAVEKEPALWDLQDRTYKSRSVCEAAWRCVAAELGATVSDVKACWNNLRYTFRVCMKSRSEMSKSGAPADDSLDEEKQWIFFCVRLLFLKDTMTGRPTSGNLKPLAADDAHSAGGTGHDETAQDIFEMYRDEELSVDEGGTCDNTQASNLVQLCTVKAHGTSVKFGLPIFDLDYADFSNTCKS
ncbi:hypothetical protein HPB49_018106 [Dermacentor silvarum]|uniref:Uncharacterized protein n=1 Tax=Dermacentor silvarum TaxID=543639 RepID=A0ACB8CSE1_DERSI|nr:hypothetical protein HPB49_018106 [Dermacentor silvarum]